MLALATAALNGVVFVAYLRPSSELAAEQAAGLAAASTRTEQVLTYTPATLQADLARARAAVTGSFGAQFQQILTQLVRPAVDAGLSTTTTVTHAGVIQADAHKVVALIYITETSTTTRGVATVTHGVAVATLVKGPNGTWLISDLRDL